jgi:hypothetical protein
MDNQFGSDQHWKRNEKSDMDFNIMKERKPSGVPTKGAKKGEHGQRQPC